MAPVGEEATASWPWEGETAQAAARRIPTMNGYAHPEYTLVAGEKRYYGGFNGLFSDKIQPYYGYVSLQE